MGHITDQDLGKLVNLSHHAVDLTVLWPSNRNVGQSPCEEMASRAQGLQKLVLNLAIHDAL
jgi:hypothetical protein